MITDVFHRRYAGTALRPTYYQEDRALMNQASHMIMDPLWLGSRSEVAAPYTETNLKVVHDQLALELGVDHLADRYWVQETVWNGNTNKVAHKNSYATICQKFLTAFPPDVANADSFVKQRLSFIELAFRRRCDQIQASNLTLAETASAEDRGDNSALALIRAMDPKHRLAQGARALNRQINEAFDELRRDLNERFRIAGYGLTFHNGMIQLVDDEQLAEQIDTPFWSAVADPMWRNVDEQVKEAVDRRDRGDDTAAFHAVCALESAIKIISDVKGWTRGTENGAANYIDNLNSQANGRFIDPWEADLLRAMFSNVRNPFAHGPGQAPMPSLSSAQIDWAIDTAMAWIKNLIRRL